VDKAKRENLVGGLSFLAVVLFVALMVWALVYKKPAPTSTIGRLERIEQKIDRLLERR